MDRGAWRATVRGIARVGYDLATKSTNHHFIYQLLKFYKHCLIYHYYTAFVARLY